MQGIEGTHLANVDNLAPLDLSKRHSPHFACPVFTQSVKALTLGALLEPIVER